MEEQRRRGPYAHKGGPKGDLECEVEVAEEAESLEDGHVFAVVVMVWEQKMQGVYLLREDRRPLEEDQIGNAWVSSPSCTCCKVRYR